MAKPIVVILGGAESSFALAKLDRSKLYPTRKRVPLDASGAPCTRAAMTADGAHVLRSGMSAQGYFTTSGRWVPKEELLGVNPDGSLAELKPSTLGVAQALEGPLPPQDLLDMEVAGVYVLEPESVAESLAASLQRGEIYRFPFNYSASYNCEIAFLVANDEGTFVLVGNLTRPQWVEEATVFVANESAEEDADELDFEMM